MTSKSAKQILNSKSIHQLEGNFNKHKSQKINTWRERWWNAERRRFAPEHAEEWSEKKAVMIVTLRSDRRCLENGSRFIPFGRGSPNDVVLWNHPTRQTRLEHKAQTWIGQSSFLGLSFSTVGPFWVQPSWNPQEKGKKPCRFWLIHIAPPKKTPTIYESTHLITNGVPCPINKPYSLSTRVSKAHMPFHQQAL